MSTGITRGIATAVSAAAIVLLGGTNAAGQDVPRVLPPVAPVHNATVASEPVPPPRPAPTRRPAALVPLYVSFAALQALDVDSTVRALHAGGREANPLLAPFAGSPPAMIALKAGMGAATIAATERAWRHHRTAAILLMIAMDSAYAAVVSHNYSLAR